MPTLMPNGKQPYHDNNGNPLSGGRVYTYAAGTDTPLATYADAAGVTPNANPVVLNARGEALIFWGDAPYKAVIKDASDVEIYTADNLQAPAGRADLASSATGKGAALVGIDGGTLSDFMKSKSLRVVDSIATLKALDKTKFTRAFVTGYYAAGDGGGGAYWYDASDATSADNGGTIIVAADNGRWKLITQGALSVRQFGAKGDGATDDTSAINAAVTVSVALGLNLYFPGGAYLSSGIPALAGVRLIGDGPTKTVIKLKSGTNAGLVTSASTNIDDVYISGITFDGNSAGNTSGDTLTLKGARPSLVDVCVKNAAGNAIVTDWNVANGARTLGCEGFFSHISIDASQQSGWVHNGPSDSHFESVIIIDSGLKTDNAYYGLFLATGPGNGRFFNCHTWNRDATTSTPASAVYVQSSGNNFSSCHFEGGHVALTITGAANDFAACSAYAPRGTYSVDLTGSSNHLGLSLGLTYATANPTYKGINLAGSNNILDLVNAGSGCTLGAVDFTSDPGQNVVRLTGNQATGSAYIGTPHALSDVTIAVSGAAGATFQQSMGLGWTDFTPTITPGSGSFTAVSATGRYRKRGKSVDFAISVTITTNGTAAGNVTATLPVSRNTTVPQAAAGRESGVTGKSLVAALNASNMNIFFYDNTYPGANGAVLNVTGVYEAA